MYLYSFKVIENGVEFYDDVWADNSVDAYESAEIRYPNAEMIIIV
jgi:hypothetical protein